jgi:mannose-6-phosphate isomerase-like protein (cupin superfamily)
MRGTFKHLAAGEGPVFRVVGGDVVTWKVLSEETGAGYAAWETVVPAGGGPPPHLHRREEEAFYIVEGDFEFIIGGRQVRAGRGAFLLVPRGVPHVFRNVGAMPGKLLVIVSPGGFERFFEEFSRLPAEAPPEPARMQAIGEKYHLEFVCATGRAAGGIPAAVRGGRSALGRGRGRSRCRC